MGPIIVRLEVDYMKQQIMHAFSERQLELKEMLEREIDAALKDFDFTAFVQAEIQRALPEIIRQSLKSGLERAMWSIEVRNQLDQMTLESLRNVLSAIRSKTE